MYVYTYIYIYIHTYIYIYIYFFALCKLPYRVARPNTVNVGVLMHFKTTFSEGISLNCGWSDLIHTSKMELVSVSKELCSRHKRQNSTAHIDDPNLTQETNQKACHSIKASHCCVHNCARKSKVSTNYGHS